MQATTYVEGQQVVIRSGGAAVPPLPQLTVSCTPSPVLRGATVSCSVSAVPSGEIEIETWSFSGIDSQGETYIFPGEADGPITDNPWRGTMAIGGTVSVRASMDGGEPQTLRTEITVQARTWEAEVPHRISKISYAEHPELGRPPLYPAEVHHLGTSLLSWRGLPYGPDILDVIFDFGPNHNLLYFKQIPAELVLSVLVHPEMESRGDFWDRQARTQAPHSRTPECEQGRFDHYVELILAHEGLPPHPQSHTGVYIQEFSRRAGPQIESLVAPYSNRSALLDEAEGRLKETHTAALTAADDPVDERFGIDFRCDFNYRRR